MKYNQFARLQTSREEQVKELQALNFIPNNFHELSFNDLVGLLFGKLLANSLTLTQKVAKLKTIAVDDEQTLYHLISDNITDLEQKQFYNAALFFLGYQVKQDYDLNDPLATFQAHGLPFLEVNLLNADNLLNAYYLLLNTRAKNGMVLIDNLAAAGYFKPFLKTPQPKHLFFNGKSLPVFDSTKVIREVVYVESDLDTDQDGQRDLLAVTVVRPGETELNLKTPVLYTANPYFGGINDVDQELHNVDENLTELKNPKNYSADALHLMSTNHPSTESEAASQLAQKNSVYSLNDYLLARGFTNVYAGGIGTYDSDGIRICGDPAETIAAKEIIEWLTGDRIAFTERNRQHQVKAWWSNESVAMTGKSYLGTLATAVATTGVKGLKTVISEAAISSWYDYYREHGLVVAPIACQGEDLDVLGSLCQSNFKQSATYLAKRKIFAESQQNITEKQDRKTGQYSDFWDVRNYRHHVDNIKCSFISVHGLNDWNVKPKNVYKLWQALQNQPIKSKLILHQGEHIYINNLLSIDFTDMMNLWLSHELLQVKNDALLQWPNVLIQDNLAADQWHGESDFSEELGQLVNYHLTSAASLSQTETDSETLTFNDVGGKQFHEDNLSEAAWEQQFIGGAEKFSATQLRFLTNPLTQDTTIVGRPEVSLSISSSLPKGQISVALVDFGKRQRLTTTPQILDNNGQALGFDYSFESLKEFLPAAKSDFKLIAKGFMNLQNYEDLKQAQTITAGKFYQLTFKLQPTYYTLPKGAKLGLIVYSTDMTMTKRPQETTIYQLALTNANLKIFTK